MKSKQWSFLTIVIIVLIVGMVRMAAHSHQRNIATFKAAVNGVAVVELFTSEGCSSCPPADALLSKLKDEGAANVFLLAFHVDYWNQLGWKDRFSSADYSARQNKYSNLLNSDLYTPQMIVNGRIEFVGSNENAARKAINEALDAPAPLSISITPHYNAAGKSVSVAYTVQGKLDDEVLNLSLVQKTAQSDVLKGENAGRKLTHVNVVRDFQTVKLTTTTGTVELTLPADAVLSDMQLVAYTQRATDLKVTGATSVSLASN